MGTRDGEAVGEAVGTANTTPVLRQLTRRQHKISASLTFLNIVLSTPLAIFIFHTASYHCSVAWEQSAAQYSGRSSRIARFCAAAGALQRRNRRGSCSSCIKSYSLLRCSPPYSALQAKGGSRSSREKSRSRRYRKQKQQRGRTSNRGQESAAENRK